MTHPLLSNTMPKLTEHEFKLLGHHTVSYWDDAVNGYVAGNMSIYAYFFHSGQEDTPQNRAIVYKRLAERGVSTATDKNGKEVKIYY